MNDNAVLLSYTVVIVLVAQKIPLRKVFVFACVSVNGVRSCGK